MITYLITCIIFALVIIFMVDRNHEHRKVVNKNKLEFYCALIIVSLLWPVTLTMAVILKIFR